MRTQDQPAPRKENRVPSYWGFPWVLYARARPRERKVVHLQIQAYESSTVDRKEMIHKAGFVDPGQLTFSHGGVWWVARAPHQQEEEEGILQLEYISFILHLLGSHLQSGPEVGGN